MVFHLFPVLKKVSSFLQVLVVLLILSHGVSVTMAAKNHSTLNVGAVVDIKSRMGKEVKTAMEIAVQSFNQNSNEYNISLHFIHPGNDDPVQVAYAAEQLIEEKQVKTLVMGIDAWQQTSIVAQRIGNRAQVPILSLADDSITPPLMSLRWPFLVQISSNVSQQIECVAAMVRYYEWRRVITIYEDDVYGGDSGMLALLSEALQNVGAEIEHHVILPPFSSLTDPERFIQEEMLKLQSKQSRVFLVLRSSLPLATLLFKEAQPAGLTGRESAWIMPSMITDLLDSLDSSVILSMEGSLGLKTYFSEASMSYQAFNIKFKENFRQEYPELDNSNSGIYALRAYDGISTITNALERISADSTSENFTAKMLLDSILSSKFRGLSGKISFNGGQLSHSSVLRIVNVIGKSYKELDFWSTEAGFSESLGVKNASTADMISGHVNWPGNLIRVPKGWAMPTKAKPLKIGVPGRTSFEKFVKVESADNPCHPEKNICKGFCIELFFEVKKLLEQTYSLDYEFIPYNGSYEDLVDHVYNKTFDAVVGDVTIIANRSKYVEFSQPYAESGLTLIYPLQNDEKLWMFTKPFTMKMWMVTGVLLFYTMFVVWFLEHRSNPEFRGNWKDQIGTTIWFTFSSLFFAHREKIQRNLTRVVVVVWLFVVLVLSASYTANLTSMLTVPKLKQNEITIQSLKTSNSKIGCDGDSFVRNYLTDVLHFDPDNVIDIDSQYSYPKELEEGHIAAAFLELPYAKVFINQYCNKFTLVEGSNRFGGLGFVFQKGSPIAKDTSWAILTLSENGVLKHLEESWFSPSAECSSQDTTQTIDSLSLQSFWALYTICAGISTICFLIFLLQILKEYQQIEMMQSDPAPSTAWDKTVRILKYFYKEDVKIVPVGESPDFRETPNRSDGFSSRWVLVSPRALHSFAPLSRHGHSFSRIGYCFYRYPL